ncbi:hypothetical protein AKO1_004116 [Acrasis kona]|uniref:Uncharacterized protein n=1 Tax=Acrasis kona TaxID=1008807 RepID=A0AAW2Z8R9_9EUKA
MLFKKFNFDVEPVIEMIMSNQYEMSHHIDCFPLNFFENCNKFKTGDGDTIMHLVVRNSTDQEGGLSFHGFGIVKCMLSNNIDLLIKNNKGETPLDILLQHTKLDEIIALFSDLEYFPLDYKCSDGETIYVKLVKSNSTALKSFREEKLCSNEKYDGNMNILHIAADAAGSNILSFEYLSELFPHLLSLVDDKGRSPLSIIMSKMVNLEVPYNIDFTNIINESIYSDRVVMPLEILIHSSPIDALLKYLMIAEASTLSHALSDGRTLLHAAAMVHNSNKVCNTLISLMQSDEEWLNQKYQNKNAAELALFSLGNVSLYKFISKRIPAMSSSTEHQIELLISGGHFVCILQNYKPGLEEYPEILRGAILSQEFSGVESKVVTFMNKNKKEFEKLLWEQTDARDSTDPCIFNLVCLHGHIKMIKSILKWFTGDIFKVDSHTGNNCLHYVTTSSFEDRGALLKLFSSCKNFKKAVNQQNNNGDTPIHLACAKNDMEMASVLQIKYGCNVNIKNNKNQLPEDLTSEDINMKEESSLKIQESNSKKRKLDDLESEQDVVNTSAGKRARWRVVRYVFPN